MSWRTFSIEHAKSGRAGCKGCKAKIGKGELRMGCKIVARSEDAYDMVKWYHVDCFSDHIRKGPESASDIEGLNSLSKHDKAKVVKKILPDWDSDNNNNNKNNSSDSDEEQDSDVDIKSKKKKKKKTGKSKTKQKQASSTKSKKRKNDSKTKTKSKRKSKSDTKKASSKAKSKKKNKRNLSDSDDSQDDEPPKKKRKVSKKSSKNTSNRKNSSNSKKNKKSKNKKYESDSESQSQSDSSSSSDDNGLVIDNAERLKKRKLSNSLKDHTVQQLKDMLRLNYQKMSGNKSDIVARIVDCKLYGCLPKCPECGTALLKVLYHTRFGHKGQGKWNCPGYVDDEGAFIRCKFKSENHIDRPKWKEPP